jgi:hypothetical protein
MPAVGGRHDSEALRAQHPFCHRPKVGVVGDEQHELALSVVDGPAGASLGLNAHTANRKRLHHLLHPLTEGTRATSQGGCRSES